MPLHGRGGGARLSPYQHAFAAFRDGRYREAESLAHRLLADRPNDPEALQLLALAVGRLGREAEAAAYLERAAQVAPDRAQCHYNLAVSCQKLCLNDLAALAYRNCLRLEPEHADALWNLGDLYRLGEHFEEAVACFSRLEEMGKIYPSLYHRLAVALHGTGEDERALEYFELALDGNSTDPALTRWEQSHALLGLGRFDEGWRAYDQRFAAGELTGVKCHPFPFPRWEGQALEGRTLLVHGEQGLGDEIMFASILPELVEEAARVILACRAPLVRLFAQSMPDVTVRAHTVGGRPAAVAALEPVDYQIPLGSLPAIRRRTREAFGEGGPYLHADPERTDYFARRLAALAPGSAHKLKVGLAWGANPSLGVEWAMRRSGHRSIPPALLSPLAALRDRVTFVSLLNRDLAGEAAQAPALDIVDFHRELIDMADTAALADSLDLVVSVDTSIAHLAGALGKPVWILLMERCDWKWLRGTTESPWYRSARLFRQDTRGEWKPLVERLLPELKGIAARD